MNACPPLRRLAAGSATLRMASLLVAGVLALSAWPQAAQAHGRAHVHGLAELDVVLDGEELTLTLASPLDSIVGFEHRPRTPAQRQAAEAALRALADPARLFGLPAAAGCTPQDQTVTAPVLTDTTAATGGDGHADLDATWRWRCQTPQALTVLQLRLFEPFATLQRLEVRHAGPGGQGRQLLRRGAPAEVRLRR